MNFITTLVSVLICFQVSIAAFAESSVIGQTYSIKERDALEEIKTKASKIPREAFFKSKSDWSALQSVSLPIAPASRKRKHIPWYTTKFDIKNPQGKVLYPKGFRFNPLQYVKMPQRVVVIREDHAQWLKENHLQTTDMVLITDGNLEKTSKYLGVPVFILDQPVKDRLGLKYVPSILQQESTYFLISEYLTEPTPISETQDGKDAHSGNLSAYMQ